MKRKIGLLMISLLAAVSAACIPVREVRAAKTSASVKDLLGYGEKEDFAIVPVRDGRVSVSIGGSGEIAGVRETMRNGDQLWHVRKSGEYYYFENKKTRQVIEAPDGAEAEKTVLATGAFNGGDGQLWSLLKAADDSFVIESKKYPEFRIDASLAIGGDAAGLTFTDGSRRTGEQNFRFVPVSTIKPVSEWGADCGTGEGKDFSEWDGSADYDWYYADRNAGTYELTAAEQLAGLSKLVSNGICDFDGRTILLGRDLDLKNLEWKPIGEYNRPFRGSFNGNEHLIRGLMITDHANYSGLFGCVSEGAIVNLAVKGSVTGNIDTGGLVGCMLSGYIGNIAGEVCIQGAHGVAAGGICGSLGESATVEHCTQYKDVLCESGEPDRGGIVGLTRPGGSIRYCANRGSVITKSGSTGGITGNRAEGGALEYCVNYGEVAGKEFVGGIAGSDSPVGIDAAMALDSGGVIDLKNGFIESRITRGIVFGCMNSGSVSGSNFVGGIVGRNAGENGIYGCMNTGGVSGKTYAGGIAGAGNCSHCFNAGEVEDAGKAGAVSGSADTLAYCRALEGTCVSLCGAGKAEDAAWTSAQEAADGTCCYELNDGEAKPDLGGFGPGWKYIFFQCIGLDKLPALTGPELTKNKDGSYGNAYHEVRVDYHRAYGTVTGDGQYPDGRSVRLTAKPKPGYLFDHYEITAGVSMKDYNGILPAPALEPEVSKKANTTLAKKINCSYKVKAVFTPKEVKKDEGKPGASEVGYLNDDGSIDEKETMQTPGEAWDYAMKLAEKHAAADGRKVLIRLNGSWVNKDQMALTGGRNIIIDLNGYTIRRDITTPQLQQDGAVFDIRMGASLGIIDSCPDRDCHPVYRGGVIEGGRNSGNGGLFMVTGGILSIKGGTLYDGACQSDGGAICVSVSSLVLDGTTIINCRSDLSAGDNDGGAVIVGPGAAAKISRCRISGCRAKNRGGAVYVSEDAKCEMNDSVITDCYSELYSGGAVYVNGGEARINGCMLNNCSAAAEGGAVYRENGTIYCKKSSFDNNSAGKSGGAASVAKTEQSWFIGCSFSGNTAGASGGAVYMDGVGLYLEDCTITGNASVKGGGGVYLKSHTGLKAITSEGAGVDLRGTMVIKNNDGADTFDNLVLEPDTYVFDMGLRDGSEVHLRSTKDGKTPLSRGDIGLVHEGQLQYFVSDAGKGISLSDRTEKEEVGLIAAAFTSESRLVLIAGCSVILGMIFAAVYSLIKRAKKFN